MDVQQKGVVTLIKSALNNCAYPLPEGFDMAQAAKVALRHKIIAMVYYGALNCGIDKKSEPMQKLFQFLIATMNITQRQRYVISKVCAAFDENGIEYMPTKGAVIQDFYPAPEMRTMGDVDILIRQDQYEQIRNVMVILGFEFNHESDHELIWYSRGLFIELHKRLIPSYNKDYAAYYGDGWRLARKSPEYEFRRVMSDEDQLIYLFTHFSKHYRDGGIGIRHFTDLYVYKKSKPALDEGYIAAELKKLKLLEFYNNICDTIAVWFYDAESNDKTDLITNVILQSGLFGTSESRVAAGGLRDMRDGKSAQKMRKERVRKKLFLPYEDMCEKYPVLKKWPVLLPVMWVVRGLKVLLFERKKITTESKKMKLLSDNHIENYDQALKAVGLSFNFKE